MQHQVVCRYEPIGSVQLTIALYTLHAMVASACKTNGRAPVFMYLSTCKAVMQACRRLSHDRQEAHLLLSRAEKRCISMASTSSLWKAVSRSSATTPLQKTCSFNMIPTSKALHVLGVL